MIFFLEKREREGRETRDAYQYVSFYNNMTVKFLADRMMSLLLGRLGHGVVS